MRALKQLSLEDRKAKLHRILRSKCHNVSDGVLIRIVNCLNMQRSYCIQVTRSPEKFLNIVTAECIGTSEKKLYSDIIPILGRFSTGYFFKSDMTQLRSQGYLDPGESAAAVKITLCGKEAEVLRTHTLVIYDPNPT